MWAREARSRALKRGCDQHADGAGAAFCLIALILPLFLPPHQVGRRH